MKTRPIPALAIIACEVVSLMPAAAAFAQGAPITRQMQDTQRKAQQKAREAKTNPDQNTDNTHASNPDPQKPKPASDAQ
ncbi:MAG TPA: hypothetical protein VL424_11420 [Pararobbsia sp.]|nr:hypothetical protein [Pararobbsia sp.]